MSFMACSQMRAQASCKVVDVEMRILALTILVGLTSSSLASAEDSLRISDVELSLVRLADLPIKDLGREIPREQLNEELLRIDFSSTQSLRALTKSFEISGSFELCEWSGNSWERPQYANDLLSDEFGLVQDPYKTWYGLSLSNSEQESFRYHIYSALVPAEYSDTSNRDQFALRPNPRDVCLTVHLNGDDGESRVSNELRVTARMIRFAIAGQ